MRTNRKTSLHKARILRTHSVRRQREHQEKIHGLKAAKESERRALEERYNAHAAMPPSNPVEFSRSSDAPMTFYEVTPSLIDAVVNNDDRAAVRTHVVFK